MPLPSGGLPPQAVFWGRQEGARRRPRDDRRRGPRRPPPKRSSMHALVVEAGAALDPLLGAGIFLFLQLLEVGPARHDVMALRGVSGLRLFQPPLRLLLVARQLVHRVPRRVHARVRGKERDEDELVAELAEL